MNPLILILILLSAYAINPSPTNPLHSAIFLSYQLSPSDPLIPLSARLNSSVTRHYGKGRADFAFVSFYIIVLSFTREFLMQRLIRPIALYCGIRSRAKQNRFMEQAYTAIYFGIFGPLGLFVMSRTPVWYFNTDAMFAGFPHRTHEGVFKAYYLLQASYWAQQAIVLCLQLEKPRKDFKELVGHHIVTLALIWLSYRFHFTYMGLAVYITHDISDFFLAVSTFFVTFITPNLKVRNNLADVADVENLELPLLPYCCSLLRDLHSHLDLFTALHQPDDSLRRSDDIPHHRPIPARLGRTAVQVQSLAVDYILTVGHLAGHQFILALLHH